MCGSSVTKCCWQCADRQSGREFRPGNRSIEEQVQTIAGATKSAAGCLTSDRGETKVQDVSPSTFFADLRKKLDINGNVLGQLTSTSDEGTSVSGRRSLSRRPETISIRCTRISSGTTSSRRTRRERLDDYCCGAASAARRSFQSWPLGRFFFPNDNPAGSRPYRGTSYD